MNITNYEEYIDIWIKIIHDILSQSNYSYDNYNYTDSEWRICSIKGEDDFVKNLLNTNYEPYSNDGVITIYKNIYNDDLFLAIPESRRSWYDFAIIYNKVFFPINIKISEWKTNDNLFWFKVLDYLLFWNFEEDNTWFRRINQRKEEDGAFDLAEAINRKSWTINIEHPNFRINDIRDYFFLSINKSDNSVKVVPFLNIKREDIWINPKNAFQSNLSTLWYEKSDDLDFKSNILKLAEMYYDYAEKKAKPFLILQWYYDFD